MHKWREGGTVAYCNVGGLQGSKGKDKSQTKFCFIKLASGGKVGVGERMAHLQQ